MFFGTLNADTQEQAIENVLVHGVLPWNSYCSCCLSESFVVFYEVNYEFKVISYNATMNHTYSCARIRCTCGVPFQWKNKMPEELSCNYFADSILYISDRNGYIDVSHDYTWEERFVQYNEMLEENKRIQEYNDADDPDEQPFNAETYFDEPIRKYDNYYLGTQP